MTMLSSAGHAGDNGRFLSSRADPLQREATRMRRQDIQLLATARQGDAAARCEVGRRYLLGVDGFPRHVTSGLDHLAQPNTRDLPQAARIIAESLPLAE